MKAKLKLQMMLQGVVHLLDFLCAQEHKIQSHNIDWLQTMWPTALFGSSPVDGANARRNNRVPARCGGVFLAIGPKLKDFVTTIGILPLGRATWAHFDHPILGILGVLAIYAPSDGSSPRARLWHEISDSLDTN